MDLDLHFTKQSKIVLMLSLLSMLFLFVPFMQGHTLLEIVEDRKYTVISIFVITYWTGLIGTNFYLLTGRQRFASIASLIALGALLVSIILCALQFCPVARTMASEDYFSSLFSLGLCVSIAVLSRQKKPTADG